jgi:hypothetical protein
MSKRLEFEDHPRHISDDKSLPSIKLGNPNYVIFIKNFSYITLR